MNEKHEAVISLSFDDAQIQALADRVASALVSRMPASTPGAPSSGAVPAAAPATTPQSGAAPTGSAPAGTSTSGAAPVPSAPPGPSGGGGAGGGLPSPSPVPVAAGAAPAPPPQPPPIPAATPAAATPGTPVVQTTAGAAPTPPPPAGGAGTTPTGAGGPGMPTAPTAGGGGGSASARGTAGAAPADPLADAFRDAQVPGRPGALDYLWRSAKTFDPTAGSGGVEFLERMRRTQVPGRAAGTTYDSLLTKHGVAREPFDYYDERHGLRHYPEGSNVASLEAGMRQQGAQRLIAGGYRAAQGFASLLTNPTASSEGRAASGIGDAMMLSSNPWMMAGGAALSLYGGVDQATSGRVQQLGNQYAQLERPNEQLAHMGVGAGRADLFKDWSKYGFSQAETTYRTQQWVSAVGDRNYAGSLASMKNNPLEMELRGLSSGTGAFLMSAARQTGTRSPGGMDDALTSARNAAEGEGLVGDRATEYLSRIAHTLQGMGERGLHIQSGSVESLATKLASYGRIAAGGSSADAYMQQERSAALSGNIQSFGADTASDPFGLSGSMQKYGRAMLIQKAAERLRARGEQASPMGLMKEMEKGAGKKGDTFDTLTGSGNDEIDALAFKYTGNASAHEADAMVRGRRNLGGVIDSFFGRPKQDQVETGSMQVNLANAARNEAELVNKLKDLTGEINKLNNNMHYWNMKAVGVGGMLTLEAAPAPAPAGDARPESTPGGVYAGWRGGR